MIFFIKTRKSGSNCHLLSCKFIIGQGLNGLIHPGHKGLTDSLN